MKNLRIALLLGAIFSVLVAQAQTIGTFTSVMSAPQDGLLHIPPGHRWQLLIQTGDSLTAGGTMPINSDFTGFVPIQGSSENGYLSVNSEAMPGGVTVLDVQFSQSSRLWEVTASEKVDFSALGNDSLHGTGRNCSGGITPWGTVITCEEISPPTDLNNDGYMDFGWVVEVDPATRTVMDYNNDNQIDKLWTMGRFNHENVVMASDSVTVYEGEDILDHGFLFKYIADQPGNLSSGDLYVLQTSGTTGSWIQVPNTTQAERNNTVGLAASLGGTSYLRIEDVDIGPDGKVYFASTHTGRIYRFKDDGNTVSEFEIFVDSMNYTIPHAGGTTTVNFSWPDNLVFDGEGNLWVTQDGGRSHIWVVGPGHTTASPQIRIFANTPLGCEPTGITFSPDYRFMFLSLQHPSPANVGTTTDASGNTVVFNRDATIVIARQEHLGPAVGAAEALEPNGLILGSIFPNPSDGDLHFELQTRKAGAARISVIEVLGRVSMNATRYLAPGDNTLQLALDQLPPGVYILMVETAEGKVSKVFTRK